MKNVTYNKSKAEVEESASKAMVAEHARKQSYFRRLAQDKNFTRYVIGIIDKEIRNRDMVHGGLGALIASSGEEIKAIVISQNAGRLTAEAIKNEILQSMQQAVEAKSLES